MLEVQIHVCLMHIAVFNMVIKKQNKSRSLIVFRPHISAISSLRKRATFNRYRKGLWKSGAALVHHL